MSDGAGQLGEYRQNRTGGQEKWDRTYRTWQIGQGNRDGTTVTGQSG